MEMHWFLVFGIIFLCIVSGLTIGTQHSLITNYINYTESTIQGYNETVNYLYEIVEYQQELIKNSTQINKDLTDNYYSLENKYRTTLQQKQDIEIELIQINEKYDNMKIQKGLINPTYKQLKDFVNRDDTDELEYGDNFDCTEYSYIFISNFAKEGYYSCGAEIDLIYEDDDGNDESGCHLIVTVNTTDRGLIYVEPQDDSILNNINIGDDYCNLVDWHCDWEITKVSNCFELRI